MVLEPLPPDADWSVSQTVSSLFFSFASLSSLLSYTGPHLPLSSLSSFSFLVLVLSLFWNLPRRGFRSLSRKAPTQRLLLRFPEPDPEATANCTHLTSGPLGHDEYQHRTAPVLIRHQKQDAFLVLIT